MRVKHKKNQFKRDNLSKGNLSVKKVDMLVHFGTTRILEGRPLVFSFVNQEKEAQKNSLSCLQFADTLQVKLGTQAMQFQSCQDSHSNACPVAGSIYTQAKFQF